MGHNSLGVKFQTPSGPHLSDGGFRGTRGEYPMSDSSRKSLARIFCGRNPASTSVSSVGLQVGASFNRRFGPSAWKAGFTLLRPLSEIAFLFRIVPHCG